MKQILGAGGAGVGTINGLRDETCVGRSVKKDNKVPEM